MFSKELENLIQATLEDGVLEEYEKAALVKRAQAEGVDLTEMEIYINSILQKRKRELKEKNDALEEKHEKEKKEAIGPICPKCHKQVPPLTLVCECGYEFTNQKRAYSMQILSEKLNAISLTEHEEEEISKAAPADKDGKRAKFLASKQINIISTFPVPNTKEDIIDFLSTSISLANKEISFLDTKRGFFSLYGGIILLCSIVAFFIPVLGLFSLFVVIMIGGPLVLSFKKFTEEMLRNAWKAKSEQVLIKGRSLRGDPEFTQQLDYYENLLNKK